MSEEKPGTHWYDHFTKGWDALQWIRRKNPKQGDSEEVEEHTGFFRARIRHKQSGLRHSKEILERTLDDFTKEELEEPMADTYEWVQLRKAYYNPSTFTPVLEKRPYEDKSIVPGYFLSVHHPEKTELEAFKGVPPKQNYIITGVTLGRSYRWRTYSVALNTGRGQAEVSFYAKSPEFKEQLEHLQNYLLHPTEDTRFALESLAQSLQRPVGWEQLSD